MPGITDCESTSLSGNRMDRLKFNSMADRIDTSSATVVETIKSATGDVPVYATASPVLQERSGSPEPAEPNGSPNCLSADTLLSRRRGTGGSDRATLGSPVSTRERAGGRRSRRRISTRGLGETQNRGHPRVETIDRLPTWATPRQGADHLAKLGTRGVLLYDRTPRGRGSWLGKRGAASGSSGGFRRSSPICGKRQRRPQLSLTPSCGVFPPGAGGLSWESVYPATPATWAFSFPGTLRSPLSRPRRTRPRRTSNALARGRARAETSRTC